MYEATITEDFLYSPGYDVGLEYAKYVKELPTTKASTCMKVYL